MKKTLIIILAVIVLIGLYVGSTYNSIVRLSVNADAQWKQVETDYQRRFDLVPNLVGAVKGIMKQEQTVFSAIADARTKYSGASSVDEKAKAAGQLENALGRLLVITENYPELKSSDTVKSLMVQLEGTENRISVQRMRFNEEVKTYNLKVKTLPSSIVAKVFGFEERSYFNSDKEAEKAPVVSI
jgi:LemA protein